MILHEIETARLRLRLVTTDNVDDMHRLLIDPDVRKYLCDDKVMPREQVASMVDQSLASFETKDFGLWAAFPHEEDTLIGFGGFWFFFEPPELQLIYAVAPTHWGKGLATEIARAMMRYGFEELSLDCIIASADAPNLASLRVMEKAGMTFEKQACINGQELMYYAIAKDAFHPDGSLYRVEKKSDRA